MRKNLLFVIVVMALLYIGSSGVKAQTLPVGTQVLEDYYRNAQLLGLIDSTSSFMARPFFPTEALKIEDGFDPDKRLEDKRWTKFDGLYKFADGKIVFKLLPVTWINQFNSDRPAGLNDGPMIPARGYQTMLSGGFYFRYDHLSIQIMPEFVNAENSNYQGFAHTRKDPELADQLWYQYYNSYLNNIDLPERFGNKTFTKAFWGQSSIRLNFGAVSFGLSTENLWWGPGIRNSLLMTNSAPGFLHFTLNTVRPVKTPIGSFEGQIISGKLTHSGFTPPEPTRNYHGGPPLYVPKTDDWRYLNGMVISYQPKWVSGLFLGMTRSFQVYEKDMGNRIGALNIGDLLPVFSPFSEKKMGSGNDHIKKRDQLSSVFMRWVWLKSHGEIYVEYGRSQTFWDQRDLSVEASNSGAYILGLKKIIPLKSKKDEYIQFNVELTQLEMNPTTRNRGGKSWYLGQWVQDGYTNQGQLLGAGIGPGSNLQTINISWVKSCKTIGIQVERFMHNSDFFNTYVKEIRGHWIDNSVAIIGGWDYKNIIFSFKAEAIKTMNYEWVYEPPPPPAYWVAGKDLFNFHGQIGITYRF